MSTYFISDIHLNSQSLPQTKLLLSFLHNEGMNADAIYILGDLFAIWLGDDLLEPYSQQLIASLIRLTGNKIPVYIMRGNRDFLIGKHFCAVTGCKFLADPYIIDLYGEKVLLTHGDKLCTLDLSYQNFRRVVQNPILGKMFLLLPIKLRKKLGLFIQRKSKRAPKDPAAYDVAPNTVTKWFKQYAVTKMIHGHTHRPYVHEVNNTKRYVLGDWSASSAKILIAKPDQSIFLTDLVTTTIY